MSLLIKNSTSSERAIGCSFSEAFSSSRSVVLNGGTIEGAPVIYYGVTLDGASDYLSYTLVGTEFNSDNISILIEFYPDFDYDEDDVISLFSTDRGTIYSATKNDNAASNTLDITLGDTEIAKIASAAYSPYWRVQKKNTLVISGTSGDTSVWLNGVNILDASATAWSQELPAVLEIGAYDGGSDNFDGRITNFKVFKSLLTAKDATDYFNNLVYKDTEQSVVCLPMTSDQHAPATGKVLDISNYNNHATIGNGSTPTSYPTKLTKKGYSFDGGDYLRIPNHASFQFGTSTNFSVSIGFGGNGGDYLVDQKQGANFPGYEIRILTNKLYIKLSDGSSSVTLYSNTVFSDDTPHFATITFNRTGDLTIYIDGEEDNSTSISALGSCTNSDYIFLGCNGGSANYFTGNIYEYWVHAFLLTSLQVKKLYKNFIGGLNNV